MAQLATGLVGAGAGFLIGGPTGAYWGWTIGVYAGTLLFPPEGPHVEGPRLGDRSVQSSTYGVPIQIVYGTIRTAGNFIWATEIEEVAKTEEVGGKGGPSATQTTYEYFGNFAVGICEGEADLLRVRANGKILLDFTDIGPKTAGLASFYALKAEYVSQSWQYRFYRGDESQLPDSLIEAHEGVGNVPAHRGLCYIVFERLPLKDYGNSIPNLTFEVSRAITLDAQTWEADKGSGWRNSVAVFDWTRNRLTTADIGGSFGTPNLSVADLSDGSNWNVDMDPILGTEFRRFVGVAPLSFNLVFVGGDKGSYRPVWEIDPDTYTVAKEYMTSDAVITEPDGHDCTSFLVGNDELIIVRYFVGAAHQLFKSGEGDIMTIPDSILHQDYDKAVPWIDSEYLEGGFYVIDGQSIGSSITIRRIRFTTADLEASPVSYTLSSRTLEATQINPSWLSGFVTGNVPGSTQPAVGFTVVDLTDGHLMILVSPSGSGIYYFVKYDWHNDSVIWISDGIPSSQTPYNYDYAQQNVVAGGKYKWLWRASSPDRMESLILDTTDGSISSGEIYSGFTFLGPQVYNSNIDLVVGYALGQSPYGTFKGYWGNIRLGAAATMDAIVSDLCGKVGWTPSDYDVTALSTMSVPGYMVTRNMRASAAIEPLASLYLFDAVEIDDVLEFVPRGGASVGTLDEQDLVSSNDGEPIQETRTAETELPVGLSLTYMDPLNDYDQQTHRAIRIIEPEPEVHSVNQLTLQIAAALDRDFVKEQAQKLLMATWIERISRSLTAGATALKYTPTDVLTLTMDDGRTVRIRLTSFSMGANLTCELSSVEEDSSQYSSSAVADGGSGVIDQVPKVIPSLKTLLVRSPLLRDSDDVGRLHSRFYFFLGVTGLGSLSAGLLFRSDSGTAYEQIGAVTSEPTWGYAVNALGSVPYDAVWVQDNVNTLNVSLANELVSMQSVTFDQLLEGTTNAAALVHSNGDVEVIKFQDVVQEANGTFTLSGLLRGRRGTDPFISGHKIGDTFILLGTGAGGGIATTELNDLGVDKYLKAVHAGSFLESVYPILEDNPGNDLKPYAPVWVESDGTAWGSNIAISWTRRTRINGGLRDNFGDVPLNEDTEEYELEVYDNVGTLVRTVTGLTTSTWTYTTAMQTADFGVAPTTIDVIVYQVSAQVGRGFPSHQTTIGV